MLKLPKFQNSSQLHKLVCLQFTFFKSNKTLKIDIKLLIIIKNIKITLLKWDAIR